jgi:hypothetical protein
MSTSQNDKRRGELRDLVQSLFLAVRPAFAPIAPQDWLDNAEVTLKSHDLRGECDGVIRFRNGRFYIFWDPSTGIRARFSLAHEVAHYLIPEHRHLIMMGKMDHWSKSDFRSDAQLEREADYVAAQLLMPGSLFGEVKPEFAHILRKAREFDVSNTACSLRTVEESRMAVSLIKTFDNKLQWAWSSEEMLQMGYHAGSLRKAASPPSKSLTARLQSELARAASSPQRPKDVTSSKGWFDAVRTTDLWEEVLPIPSYNATLTLLIHES